jgi:hypothetical protein
MASIPVTLKVADFKDREVANVTYSFEQAVDKENQPAGIPRGGKVEIRVKAMNDGNPELLKWMLNKTMAKKGEILFMNSSDADKKMKSIEFENAYCVNFTEHWEDVQGDTDLAHYEEIVIVCKKITVEGVTFENQW